DLGGHPADAGASQADGTGSTRGEVEHAATDERATVIDGDDNAAAAMGHAQPSAERQRTVGRGHSVLVEARAGSGLAAGLIAVEGGYAREAAAAGRRGDRGIGVTPGAACSAVGRGAS